MKKKNLYILITAVVIGGVVVAQTGIFRDLVGNDDVNTTETLSVGIPGKIVPAGGEFFMSPRWSPDGKYIAYSGSNHKGIYVKNLTTNETKQVTAEDAAGYGCEWSPDSKVILSRVAKYEGAKRYNAVKLFFMENKEEKLLTDYKTFMPDLPHWTSNGEKIYLHDGKKLDVIESGIAAGSLKKNTAPQKIVYSRNNKIYVGEPANQNFNSFEPLKDQEYINVTTSPDGLKIAFEVYGGNLYVINSDGTGLIDLGNGNRPQWSADSKRLVYIVTEDNGENYTSSDIFTVKADGSDKIQLTESEDILEMNPTWSPDGKQIAYHEMNEGAIYILSVNIP